MYIYIYLMCIHNLIEYMCICVYMYICICLCVYIYIYIYMRGSWSAESSRGEESPQRELVQLELCSDML